VCSKSKLSFLKYLIITEGERERDDDDGDDDTDFAIGSKIYDIYL